MINRLPIIRAFVTLGWKDSIFNFPLIGAIGMSIFILSLAKEHGLNLVIRSYYLISDQVVLVPLGILSVILALIGIAFGFFSDSVIEKLIKSNNKTHTIVAAILEISLTFQLMSVILLLVQSIIIECNCVIVNPSDLYNNGLFVWLFASVLIVSYSVLSTFNLILVLVDLLRARVEMQ